ncbi:MAG: chalcone isomerase family protein [Planctomycetota bacterium]
MIRSRAVMRSPLVLLVLVACTGATTLTRAAEPPSGMFAREIEVAEIRLIRNGAGLCEWGIFSWDVYWAALYLERPTTRFADIVDSKKTKRIHLNFSRKLSREQMVDAYRAAFEANAGKKRQAELKASIDQLLGMLTAVKAKDSLRLTYVPDVGTSLKLNGKQLGLIEGAEFGSLVFELYVGKKPPTKALKKGLLGPEKWHAGLKFSEPKAGESSPKGKPKKAEKKSSSGRA